MKEDILYFLNRDLKKLIKEIEAYTNEDDLWIKVKDLNNSAGTLALHIVGNLNHYVGHTMGGTDYVRNREFEFSGTKVPRKEIVQSIENTLQMVNAIAPQLSEERLYKTFEYDFAGKQSTLFYLFQFTTHLAYHLGQINYHRRGVIGTKNS